MRVKDGRFRCVFIGGYAEIKQRTDVTPGKPTEEFIVPEIGDLLFRLGEALADDRSDILDFLGRICNKLDGALVLIPDRAFS